MSLTGRETVSGRGQAALAFAAFVVAFFAAAFPTAAPAWAQDPATSDLSITKEGPRNVEPGANFSYVLTVTNAEGAATAATVEVTDELPAGVTFRGDEPDVCGDPPGDADGDGRQDITCEVTNLAAGESATITLAVTASNDPSRIRNVARADDTTDDVPAVESNAVTTRVVPDLEINKLDDPDPVTDTQDLLLYTLRVQNEGNRPAFGVAVTDDLPLDQVDLVTFDSNDFNCEYTAGLLQCNVRNALDPLAPGEVVRVEVVVEPEVEGTIRNTGAAFACGARGCVLVDTDTEATRVRAADDGDGGGDGNGDGNGNGNGNNNGDDPGNQPSGDDSGDEDDVTERTGVIASTIPNKTLPDTGGSPLTLLVFGAGLACIGAALLRRR